MARGGNLDLALRIRADLDQALSGLRQVQAELGKVGAEGKRTGRDLASVDASGLDKVGKAGQDAAQGTRAAGEAADATATRIRNMVQASLEHQRAMQAQIATQQGSAAAQRAGTAATAEQAEAYRKINQAAYASQAAITAQVRSIGELHERLERGARSAEDLADTEQLLDRAMQAGLVSAEEQTEVLAELDRQEKRLIATQEKEARTVGNLVKAYDPASAALKKLEQDEIRLKKAVDNGVISRESYNRAMVGVGKSRADWLRVNASVEQTGKSLEGVARRAGEVRRSLTTAATNLATGNIAGAGDALVRVGVTGAGSMTVLAGAVAGVVAVLAGLALAAFKGYQDQQQLNRVLIAGGEASGVTESAFYSMADSIDHTVNRIGKGREALMLLIGSGRVTAETLQMAGQAAVAMSELTGRSIQDTTREVQQLLQEPSRYAAELNRQYHFLTAAQYERIRALEAEGRATDAARIAIDAYGAAASERLAETQARLGTLEKLWKLVANSTREAWEEMKSIGREDSLGEQLTDNTALLQQYERRLQSIYGNTLEEGLANPKVTRAFKNRILQVQAQIAQLDKLTAAEQKAAEAAAQPQRIQDAAVVAQDVLGGQLLQADRLLAKKRDELALEQKINALRAAGITMLEGQPLDEAAAKIRADIAKRYAEPKKPKVGLTDEQRDAKALAEWVDQLERQAAVMGMTKDQTLQYEIAERGLTGALRERALAAAETLRQAEEDEALKRDAESLAQVQVQYLRSIGKASEAAELELEQRYGELLKRLKARGDVGGQDLIENTINIEKARVRLAELQGEVERFQADIARKEQQINTEQEAGLISSVEAREKVLQLRQQEIEQIGQLLPLLREAAIAAGDEQAIARIDDLTSRLQQLQVQTSELQLGLRNGLENGLGTALQGLATNMLTLRDAATGLLRDVMSSLAQVASQQLAAVATSKIMGLFGGGKTPDLQSPDPAQAASAGAAYAAPIGAAALALGGSAIPLLSAAGAISAAAAALAAAGAAAGGAGGGGEGDGLSGLLGAALGIFGFAEGGAIHGPGTGTSDSILARVSDGEYVVRAAAVRRYGIGVLDALNSMQLRNMPMLPPSAMPAPQYQFADGGPVQAGGAAAPFTLRNYTLFDINDLAQRLAEVPAFEKAVVNKVIENSGRVTEALQR